MHNLTKKCHLFYYKPGMFSICISLFYVQTCLFVGDQGWRLEGESPLSPPKKKKERKKERWKERKNKQRNKQQKDISDMMGTN